ncbi:MAG TPA: zinc metalloprotease HtpX [Geobacterales bacterium]|nr:zinc metalloprotease HtpX [Geobacterales bacterium]
MDIKAQLRMKMFIASSLTVLAEAIVVLFILSFLNLSLFYAVVLLPLYWLIQWLISPYLVLGRAKEINQNDPSYGWLYRDVEEIAKESGVRMPKVFITNDPFPNAFAFGNYVSGKRVAITKPLLDILNEDELKAVIAHEIGHIKHYDVEIGMAIGLIPSTLGFIGNFLLNIGLLQITFALDEIALVLGFMMLAIGSVLLALTLFINVFMLWFNRLRESYADLHSVSILKENALNLARGLAKIQIYMKNVRIDPFRGIIVTVPPMKIKEENPEELLNKWLNEKVSPFADALMTHPHPAKRVQLIYKAAS